jgi:hypothetical protein
LKNFVSMSSEMRLALLTGICHKWKRMEEGLAYCSINTHL